MLARIKDWLTGGLVVLVVLVFVPGLLSVSVLPALILIVLIGLIGLSFRLGQAGWGWLFLVLAVALVVLWFIPGTQFTLPNLSF